MADDSEAIRCELICFVRDKCNVLPLDDIVKICTDFYKEEEVLAAKELIERAVPDRLPKRKGNDKRKSTVEDIVRICLQPTVTLPTYYAVDISRLPPVSATHCDLSAILAELQALRHEVREVTDLRNEVESLKHQVAQLKVSTSVDSVPSSLRVEPTPAEAAANYVALMNKPKFAALAQQLQSDALAFKSASSEKRKRVQKLVVGSSASNHRIKSVPTRRNVDIFVSRLHPETSVHELEECVEDMKGDINVQNVVTTKLKSKYESLYSSFHVAIEVDSADLHRAVEVFMSAEYWPFGVFVKRYFRPKDGATQ
jgi:hypothetical protein